MIYKNEDGTIYKVDVQAKFKLIPVLASSNDMKPLEDKVDVIIKAVLELEEVVNFLIKEVKK